MNVDPTSWLLLLAGCAAVAGLLIANGLRLRRADVDHRAETSPKVAKTETDKTGRGGEIGSKVDGGLVRLSAAILVGGFGLVVMIVIPPLIGLMDPEVAFSAAMFRYLAIFVVLVVMCFVSLLRSGASWGK